MSYARFGWDGSDVYVILTPAPALECCGCTLSDDWEYRSTDSMLTHLQEHVDAGETVPEDCIERLTRERETNDALLATVAKPPPAPPEPVEEGHDCTCGGEDSDGRGDVLRCPVHGQGEPRA